MLFRTIVHDAHTHLPWLCHWKFPDGTGIIQRTNPALRIDAQVLTSRRFFTLHCVHLKISMPGKSRYVHAKSRQKFSTCKRALAIFPAPHRTVYFLQNRSGRQPVSLQLSGSYPRRAEQTPGSARLPVSAPAPPAQAQMCIRDRVNHLA